MVRKLKYHEQKLLKKVNLTHWKNIDNVREAKIMQRYYIQDRDDYAKYNRICGNITKLADVISCLPADDPFRNEITDKLLEKLYNLGFIRVKERLSQVKDISASSICRRRLPVVMCQIKMAETLKEAVTFVEQGHVRVGPETITDPAYIVTRNLEDFVTWVDTSKIKKKVAAYNDQLDDYDLM